MGNRSKAALIRSPRRRWWGSIDTPQQPWLTPRQHVWERRDDRQRLWRKVSSSSQIQATLCAPRRGQREKNQEPAAV